jgi:hypothetical protein
LNSRVSLLTFRIALAELHPSYGFDYKGLDSESPNNLHGSRDLQTFGGSVDDDLIAEQAHYCYSLAAAWTTRRVLWRLRTPCLPTCWDCQSSLICSHSRCVRRKAGHNGESIRWQGPRHRRLHKYTCVRLMSTSLCRPRRWKAPRSGSAPGDGGGARNVVLSMQNPVAAATATALAALVVLVAVATVHFARRRGARPPSLLSRHSWSMCRPPPSDSSR